MLRTKKDTTKFKKSWTGSTEEQNKRTKNFEQGQVENAQKIKRKLEVDYELAGKMYSRGVQ